MTNDHALYRLSHHDGGVSIRPAAPADLPAILVMLADDPLGRSRERVEDRPPAPYVEAFQAIAEQRGNVCLVAERKARVVGCLQLTLIPGLSRLGAMRAQIESVRVAAEARGAGLGQAMFEEAIARARACGCAMVQLTTDASRPDAKRFYERLGFVASHLGMKLSLSD